MTKTPIVLVYINAGAVQAVASNVHDLQIIIADQDVHDEQCETGECRCDLEALTVDIASDCQSVAEAQAEARKEMLYG